MSRKRFTGYVVMSRHGYAVSRPGNRYGWTRTKANARAETWDEAYTLRHMALLGTLFPGPTPSAVLVTKFIT